MIEVDRLVDVLGDSLAYRHAVAAGLRGGRVLAEARDRALQAAAREGTESEADLGTAGGQPSSISPT
jgi:hypothetical protein